MKSKYVKTKRDECTEKYPCVIFDLDGTLADVTMRRDVADHAKFSSQPPPKVYGESYHKYNKRKERHHQDMWWKRWQDPEVIMTDKPNTHVVSICKLMKEFMGCAIIITSARTAKNMTVTKEWLAKYNIYYDELFMRPEGDFTPDNIFKKRILDKFILPKYEVLMAFDDRNQVVKMWRDNDIPCLQVADGDF